MRLPKFLTAFALLLLFFSCRETPKNHPHTYYFWRTKLALFASEKAVLAKAEVPKLYTRFFDVDKMGGKFQPIGVVTKDKSFDTDKEIVPVVFLRNRVFVNIQPQEISFLAGNIFNLIKKKQSEFNFKNSEEIQVDCDWTAGTRADYFQFLKELQKISGKNITCTLRLHQVKDKAKTGIPPVGKVYLMCYSTTSPLENSDKNSILDVDLAKNYLKNLENYPIINMDLALPIYSWGIVTNHLGKRKIINGLNINDLNNKNFKEISGNSAEVLQDGFYFGNYMSRGFTVKIEAVSNAELDELLIFLDKKLMRYNTVYYQLDRKFVENRDSVHQ